MMLPVIALIGRPNVGKSTLFNQLTRSRDALVLDMPGVTRDRLYGEAEIGEGRAIVIDTGGLSGVEEGIEDPMAEQAQLAIAEADLVIFLVDARDGVMPQDQAIAKKLREQSKPMMLVVNKTDGLDADIVLNDFYQLGLGEPIGIAASHKRGIQTLRDDCARVLEIQEPIEEVPEHGICFTLIGRPNVGKSTLTNRMLGEERVIVYDMPGTTRDSISIPYERHGEPYTVIDTAGVRRRGRVKETIEKFSVVKTLQAIERADIAVLVIDAQEGLTDQDLHLVGFALDAGRGLVIAINKWDGLDEDHRNRLKFEISRRLDFVHDYIDVHFISALHGTNVGHLYKSIKVAYESATKEIPPAKLTKVLEDAVTEHQPPSVSGRRIKLRYAHIGGHKPPVIVLHGTQVEKLPQTYQRFLVNRFRKVFKLHGTPVRLSLKSSSNPFEGRRNTLSPRQIQRKKRLMRFVKKRNK